jgi:DNA-binding GntR family transcriptional regulator
MSVVTVSGDSYDAPGGMPLTRAGAVAKMIREMIISGDLPPGSRLRQNDIAEKLGVSSTPVREAFLVLTREGLVRQDTHRGAVVFEPTAADVQESYEMRIALESLATEIAAKQIGRQELEQLDTLLKQMRDALRTDLDLHTKVLNQRFHMTIYRATRRPRLIELIETLRDTAAIYQTLLVQPSVSAEYLDAVQAEHEEIVAALRARAPKRAARATGAHLEHSLAQMMANLPAQETTESA